MTHARVTQSRRHDDCLASCPASGVRHVHGVMLLQMVPMEDLKGRSSAEAHRWRVKSAADGGFNTLRLWGGGIFSSSMHGTTPATNLAY